MTLWMIWSTLASLVVAAAALALDRGAAELRAPRRFVWLGAMVCTLVLPLSSTLKPPPGRSLHSGSGSVATAAFVQETVMKQRARATARLEHVDRFAARAWLIASGVMLALFLRSLLALRHRREQWVNEQTRMGPLLVSNNDGPAVVGVLRPRVVAPRWALDLGDESLDLLIRHEREHIYARDLLTLFTSETMRIAVPWNAPLWWMARRLRLAIEIDCDARVLRSSGNAHSYGMLLLSVGERHAARLPFATALTEPTTTLESRIAAMTRSHSRHPLAAGIASATLAVALIGTVAFAPRPVPWRHVGDPHPLRGNRAPRYPDALRSASVEGDVVVDLVTDAHGIPDSSSIQVLESTDTRFADAVRKVLPSWRFDSGGHARLGVRFLFVDTEEREANGQPAPKFGVDVGPPGPVIVVATRL